VSDPQAVHRVLAALGAVEASETVDFAALRAFLVAEADQLGAQAGHAARAGLPPQSVEAGRFLEEVDRRLLEVVDHLELGDISAARQAIRRAMGFRDLP
jgi:hypothetical protein